MEITVKEQKKKKARQIDRFSNLSMEQESMEQNMKKEKKLK